jgi:F420H(2)-dependent quinone reductase
MRVVAGWQARWCVPFVTSPLCPRVSGGERIIEVGRCTSWQSASSRRSDRPPAGEDGIASAAATVDHVGPQEERLMPERPNGSPRLPPRWVVRTAWIVHRAIYRLSGGRRGLWRPTPNKWGTMRLTTIGRRSGRKRSAILGYYEDGPNLVTLAMNGWADGEPAWWLNLQAHPDASVDLADGRRAVRARAAEGDERSRLWARWRELGADVDAYATRRSSETAVVILEGLQTDPGA